MQFYSLQHISPAASFREATIRGQAPDKGLYFPTQIPKWDKTFIRHPDQYSPEEIAFRVIQPYVGDSIPEDQLFRICAETIGFPIPLVEISENIFSLELFHGPTLAFK